MTCLNEIRERPPSSIRKLPVTRDVYMGFILTQRSNPSRIYMEWLPVQKPTDWENARDLVLVASVAQHRSNAEFH
jgi:hypothetical protein